MRALRTASPRTGWYTSRSLRTRNVSTSSTFSGSRIEDITGVTVNVAITAPSKRIGIGARHRPENLAFHALHREQRQKGGNGDDDGEEDRLVDFNRCRENPVQLVANRLTSDG